MSNAKTNSIVGAEQGSGVFEYTPPKIELGAPKMAKDYIESKSKKSSGFRMSEVIRLQTGVAEIESEELDRQIEEKVLERLKSVQEPAYQEAYQLGLEEGKAEAFKKASQEIENRLSALDELLISIRGLKETLVDQNESHLVQLVFHMAKRLAFTEVSANSEALVKVVRECIQVAQAEEEVVVHLHPEQIEFVETLRQKNQRELEFLKKLKIEPNETVDLGGCIIETNYGEIDARFEQRVSQMWQSLGESLPKVKDKLSTDS